MTAPRTLFRKVWDRHVVVPETAATPAVLYIDLHLVHEVTSPQAFAALRERGLKVRRPDRTLATVDHSVPTAEASWASGLGEMDHAARYQVRTLGENCGRSGVRLFGVNSARRGIVHVIGPEQGATQPGMTIVCGDSHTTTHGAFGALAFGIGTTEVGHVLATQCLLQRLPRTLLVELEGRLGPGVTAKDVILGVIGRIGVDGGTGHVIEFRGEAVSAMSMEERMTLCNMAIEAGARAGMVAPDETTFEYLAGRPMAPQGEAWERAVVEWRELNSDPGAEYDRSVTIDVGALEPQVTWGTDPGMVMPVSGRIPAPAGAGHRKALDYMGLSAGAAIAGQPVQVVFIGSCTNSRLSDLRAAAAVLRGRRVAPGVRAMIVPGSQQVRAAAEAEGLDRVFRDAGAEWHQSGCSLCIAMNGDRAAAGQYVVSTSNRNFEGRQGQGARTLLASPLTAAASAITGKVADPRPLLEEGRRIA
ncbi:3-isopropylmalate dehydratase large subunit [Thioalkalivibrio sp. XN8]|uniref:3-isopropylmalate dehydratase large subunit n=1 Tax=Thioalkalivibrio sp. XN8 TaxID=2712863 RepID=UPI0013EC123D|nr:3-isopropylmalate dehydratase large subunit [Thioalkalivibrio sp. XN8]NGP52320.1 3-isopropylmalate dehydratase large subunit [Thioalkalivibrio sp. XN8]